MIDALNFPRFRKNLGKSLKAIGTCNKDILSFDMLSLQEDLQYLPIIFKWDKVKKFEADHMSSQFLKAAINKIRVVYSRMLCPKWCVVLVGDTVFLKKDIFLLDVSIRLVTNQCKNITSRKDNCVAKNDIDILFILHHKTEAPLTFMGMSQRVILSSTSRLF